MRRPYPVNYVVRRNLMREPSVLWPAGLPLRDIRVLPNANARFMLCDPDEAPNEPGRRVEIGRRASGLRPLRRDAGGEVARHRAGAGGAGDAAPHRARLPASARRPARQAGHRLRPPQARNLRARLLLWHGHDCPRGARAPKANADYWQGKIARNRARDEKTLAVYAEMGWRTLVVYECELKEPAALDARLAAALTPG